MSSITPTALSNFLFHFYLLPFSYLLYKKAKKYRCIVRQSSGCLLGRSSCYFETKGYGCNVAHIIGMFVQSCLRLFDTVQLRNKN